MFGSTNSFGQSSNSPFGSPAPGFGNSNPFGFGFGTSTGVFGATQSPSTPAFGASSSSTPASFGTTTSSVFGQKPAFGGFGSSTAQASPFGSTFQQPQAGFGTNQFGSTQFGATSQPAFGASTTPAFGSASSTPAFGATNTPAFGVTSTPAFGSTTTPAFGSTGSAFGASTAPVFGSGSAFGVSNTPTFGTPGTPAFGASTTPAFGASSAPSFSFGSTPAFGQSTSPFGAQSSPFGSQATTPSFGSSGFGQSAPGGQRGGSRVTAYSATPEVDGTSQPTAAKLESISAMPVYKEKSHEELRWEDYQLGDKGGPSSTPQSTGGGIGFGSSNTQANPFGSSPTFGQSSANPFSSTTPSNPFGSKSAFGGTSGIGTPTTAFGSSPFGTSTTSNIFGSTSSATSSIFGSSSSPGFGQSPSLFGSAPATGATQAFGTGMGFGNTQSSPLFQSTTPSLGQTNPVFGQNPSFGQSNPAFGQTTNPAFGQSNGFSTPSTGFGGNMFSSTSSLTSSSMGFGQTTPSLSTPFQSAQPAQTVGSFGFGNFGQTQSAGTSGFGGTPGMFGQSNFGQAPATQSSVVAQPVPVTNPFGTLPAMPQMSIGRSGAAPSVQYGISSLPVVDKPAPVRISSLLTSRHLSQSRIRLPARRYHPKNEGAKVPFFNDDEETPSIPKADALFVPRENPRALVIRPLEQWPPRTNSEKSSPLKEVSAPRDENEGRPVENGKKQAPTVNLNQKPYVVENDITNTEDIAALMPKLGSPDYYTEPRMQELAARERAEPGFCRHVKDFVIGRHGFGSIKFIGETDVRGLDIESLVQFNNREVIVYMDETKKPPVGQGLNKPAEVTLLNIKCFDKKTGLQYTEGLKINRYMDMLRKKAEDQGAKFVSYDPINGEWKFRVSHFSTYSFGTEDEDDSHVPDC